MAGTVCVRIGTFLLAPSSALVAAGGDVETNQVATLNAMSEPAHSASSGETSCHSCGATADDLARVRRVYVTPGAWDLGADEPAADTVQVVDEVESWCFPCRSQYPHQPVED
jgi:hypothetical protein